MFDMGFWELMLIGILSLIVLGPERMPTAIRTVRDWISSARKFSEGVKTELKEELRINELHENLKKAEQSNLQDLSPEVAESVQTLKDAADMVNRPYDSTSTESILSDPIKNDNTSETSVQPSVADKAQVNQPHSEHTKNS